MNNESNTQTHIDFLNKLLALITEYSMDIFTNNEEKISIFTKDNIEILDEYNLRKKSIENAISNLNKNKES